MKKVLVLFLGLALVLTFTGITTAKDGEVTVMSVWGGQELEAFKKAVKPFEEATGIEVKHESTRNLPTLLTTRLEAGNPPDIVHFTGIGMMEEYAQKGDLVDLKDVFKMKNFKNKYNQKWIDLSTYKNGMYGLYISADVKSLVWYNPKKFEEKGYTAPETWDELQSLMTKMKENGDTPWSVGLEAGGASGWPGTDWIEDIMLRTAGPEIYDKWVNHDISWTDPRVKEAWKKFGNIVKSHKNVWGGPMTVLSTNFGDAASPLFMDPPRAYMHKQASFVTSFIKENNPNLEAGKDFDFFVFPPINEEHGTPIMGAADMLSMMNDNPEAKAFMKYMSTAGAQSIWVGELGKLGTNKNINPNMYPDDMTRKMAKVLRNADSFRFDGSDSMPSAIGSGAFWKSIMNYVEPGGDNLDKILKQLEEKTDEVYNTGAATN